MLAGKFPTSHNNSINQDTDLQDDNNPIQLHRDHLTVYYKTNSHLDYHNL